MQSKGSRSIFRSPWQRYGIQLLADKGATVTVVARSALGSGIDLGVQPALEPQHIGVHTWVVRTGTTVAPAHNTCNMKDLASNTWQTSSVVSLFVSMPMACDLPMSIFILLPCDLYLLNSVGKCPDVRETWMIWVVCCNMTSRQSTSSQEVIGWIHMFWALLFRQISLTSCSCIIKT